MVKARIEAENPKANLQSYEKTYQQFSWSEIAKEFTWPGTGKVNMVYEAIDRWVEEGKGDEKALIYEKKGEVQTFSYLDLKEISSQWACLFLEKGFQPGDRLFIFLPPCPEIYFALLACARLGVIFSILFSSLNFDDISVRLTNARPRGILTHPDLVERLPLEVMEEINTVFYTHGPLPGIFKEESAVEETLKKVSRELEPGWFSPDTPLYLCYTSGSTGPPKGVIHVHGDMVGHLLSARTVLDLSPGDILWTDGDPAWVTGTVYGTFAPWLCQAVSVVQGDPFSASNWYRTLERHHVTVWYTSPMNIRRLVEAGEDLPGRYDFSTLRHIACVGDALLPELFYWTRKNLKHSPHDTWWMTETGMICLANFPSLNIKPGSMGKPVPGIQAAILDEKGEPLPLLSIGELALKLPWPSLMQGIWQDEERYQEYFRVQGWFLTGDMALRDEEGYFYHQGRTDDLIKVGEKVIGPFEIEQILCMHPAVEEAGVIAQSSVREKSVIKAFITLTQEATASARLKQEIKSFIKAQLSPDLPIREITILKELPKTRSGKLLRRVLRTRELGLPSGDPAKMEE